MPLIFVVGGVNKSTNQILADVWTGLSDQENSKFTKSNTMNFPRKKPFLLSPTAGIVLAISGYFHALYPNAILKSCEKYIDKENRWIQIANLNNPPTSVFLVSGYIYAFRTIENSSPFERLNITSLDSEWEIYNINTDLTKIDIADHFSLTSAKDPNDFLYIFGGVNQIGEPSRNIYTLDGSNGRLSKHDEVISEKVNKTLCVIDSKEYTWYITDTYKICLFVKDLEKFEFLESHITRKAKEKGINFA